MTAELHLPDLPEVPVAIGIAPETTETRERRRREAFSVRLRGMLTTYLPVLLMSALAAATWWLARYSPRSPDERSAQAVRHDPDYTAERAKLQRYNPDGQLIAQVEGEQVRHFPDTDEIEVDTVRLATAGADGRRTEATARQALAAGDGSRYSLQGGAHVVSTGPDGRQVDITGEHLLVLAQQRQVQSDKPVTVRQGGSVLVADAMDFDEATQFVTLHGRVRATLLPLDVKATAK
ncbi:LPS export ABC transporter periplasmic protein LptC [Ideonella sp. YS5]|uniref:LPS export ABC transporter periplasmic protein LptC n=1 Tax=Ideonella sp. YS5 TaxID=3453714 RepID=UPI003EED3AD3